MAWKSVVVLSSIGVFVAARNGYGPNIIEFAATWTIILVLGRWMLLPLIRRRERIKERREFQAWQNDFNESVALARSGYDSFQSRRSEADRHMNEIVDRLIDKHIDTLANKRRATVTVDDYGIEETDKWKGEIAYFINRVVLGDQEFVQTFKSGMPRVYDLEDGGVSSLVAYIDQRAKERQQLWDASINPPRSVSTNVDDLGPLEFEQFCADVMSDYGWQSKTTKGSGDQGVDVIAERDGIRAVLQCKKYTSPIGNKAVQEAHAGKVHYSATVAAVVSNMPFTPSAKQLAATTGVHLLHYTDLPDFAERLVS